MHALVGTGCTTIIGNSGLVNNASGVSVIVAFDGREVSCKGSANVELCVYGNHTQVDVAVAEEIIDGISVVLGMDVIKSLGGDTVNECGVRFGTSFQGVGMAAVNSSVSESCVVEN